MAFDFSTVVAPFRMQPGLRRMAAPATHLTPTGAGDAVVHEKLCVLRRCADEALLVAPGFDAAAALDALAAHAAAAHPAAFVRDALGAWSAPALGWSLQGGELRGRGAPDIGDCLRALPACWRLAGLLSLAFAEDLALVDGASGRIPWMAVCLPSRWAPQDKIGLHFAAIHAGVAEGQALVAAAEALVRLVTAGEHWERSVWTITASPRRDGHPRRVPDPGWPVGADPEALAARAFFRTERQTFLPLPQLRLAVFTIRVEVQPLAVALTSADAAARVHAALQSMSPAVLAYRGLAPARDGLLRWLEARRGAAQ